MSQLDLFIIGCVSNSNCRIMCYHLFKKELHACDRVKLCASTRHRKVGTYHVFMCSLDRNSCHRGGFESFRLVLGFYLFTSGAGSLGGHHGGVIGIGHRPMGALVEISMGESGGLES